MRFSALAVALLTLAAPAAVQAATTITFNGVCAATATATQAACSVDASGKTALNGTYGNSATLTATNDSTLKVMVTAWQAKQDTAAGVANITNAYLGAYGGGFGVTGVQDVDASGTKGGGNTHQIDNVNGYTDFVMLQFSRAVHLEGTALNYYGINGVYDSDASFFNASGVTNTSNQAITTANWNSTVNLANGAYVFDPTLAGWSSTTSNPDNATTYGSVTRTNTAAGFSQVWLVSASVLTTDRDDGFKLAQIMVTPQIPAVPEPATWGMMIVGFGAIGAGLRRRRAKDVVAAA